MVFVKVRETYDLNTIENKMSVIAIHTPKPDIIKKNYPGLLMQCRAYRPVSADVRVACASVLPLDPLGVGTSAGSVSPEDVFNPILYKAISNKGMSQLEARINGLALAPAVGGADVDGSTAVVDVDSLTDKADEFSVYYGLLSQTDSWKHANPQQGLSMSNLKPLVYEMVYNVGDTESGDVSGLSKFAYPGNDGTYTVTSLKQIVGSAKPMPFINCTSYSGSASGSYASIGFPSADVGGLTNNSVTVPWINVVCGVIIVPPSRLHKLYYRMVVEWTIEFSMIRPVSEITDWNGVALLGTSTHYQNYSYSSAKEAITGDTETILENDTCMVSANVDIEKVM